MMDSARVIYLKLNNQYLFLKPWPTPKLHFSKGRKELTKDVLCELCAFATTSKNDLRAHMESMHELKHCPVSFFVVKLKSIHDKMHWFLLIYWHPLTQCFTILGSSEWTVKQDVSCFASGVSLNSPMFVPGARPQDHHRLRAQVEEGVVEAGRPHQRSVCFAC